MSLDKSSGSGDQHPDKAPGPDHRPFPGAPEDRPVPSKPVEYRSFEEIRADRAARAAGKTPGEGTSGQAAAGHSAGEDATGPGKGPAGAGPGTADAGPRGSAAAPGSREKTGAVPGNVPARGEETRPVPRAPGGQDVGRPGIPDGHRPDAYRGETDRVRLRPFPGAAEDRPVPSRPVEYRSFEEIRADRAARAGDKSAGDRGPARAVERPVPGQPAAKDDGRAAKDVPESKSAVGTPTERGTGSREQGRAHSEQADSRQAQEGTGTSERPAERPRAEATPPWKEVPGTPGTDPSAADSQHQPGHAPVAPDAHRVGDKAVITYAHAEFHGQKFGAYTDGTHWVSEEAVRAMARKNEQSKSPDRHGITDFPQQRDLGDNTVGENPDVHLGDTSDLRTFADKVRGEAPFAQKLGEKDDPSESKLGRAFDSFFEDADDGYDASGNIATAIDDILPRGPGPTGTHTLVSGHSSYEAAPTQGLNASDVVGSTVLVVTAVATGIKHFNAHRRRDL